MDDLITLYKEAVETCDVWRRKRPLSKATPNEIHLYNVFTQAKRELEGQLACIEDVLGVYNKKDKAE